MKPADSLSLQQTARIACARSGCLNQTSNFPPVRVLPKKQTATRL